MEFLKIFYFVKKHKTAIFLPLICFLQFLACFYNAFWIIATVLAVILLLLSEFAELIYYILFFQMFSSLGNFSVICTFVASAVICIKYILGLVHKKEKFYPVPFILTCVICVFCSIHFTTIDKFGIYQGSSLIVSLFVIYLIFTYRDRLKIEKCADFIICGVLATAGISVLTMLFDGSLINFFDGTGEFKRLRLLTSNENSLSIYCSLALSVFISCLINGKGNIWKNIIFSIVTVIVGLSTLSKCFLLVCVFIIAYLVVMLILKYKLKSLNFILPAFAVLAMISFAMHSKISTIIERFFVHVDQELTLSAITTGRSDLWTIYINKIRSSIVYMLFGVGFFSERIIKRGPHNLLIHLLYRMGFIGLLMLGILAYYYYKSSEKKLKLTFKNCLPLLVFLMISMVESFL